MLITVAEDYGYNITLYVEYWTIVWDVKVAVSACGTHPVFLHLEFRGVDLQDDCGLLMYDIDNLATVRLVRVPSRFLCELWSGTAWVQATERRLRRQARRARLASRRLWQLGVIIENARRRLRRRVRPHHRAAAGT